MRILFIARQPNLFQQFAFPHFSVGEDYQIIDEVLSDEQFVREMAKDIPDSATGRNRTPVEQTLRFLVLKHQKGLDYRGMEQTLKENLSDRWFCKVNESPPCFKTIQNQLSLLSEERIKAINDRIISAARQRKLTRGRKLRIDSTIVEANLHYPTDSSLIVDALRVITRTVQKLQRVPKGFRSFKRKIRQQVNLLRTLGRKQRVVREQAVRELVQMGRHISRKLAIVAHRAVKQQRVLLNRVVDQAEQVLSGIKPTQRIVSIFEPTARPLPKGKAGKPCEFGHEVQIQETDGTFITSWEINNRPTDTAAFSRALTKHRQLFNHRPQEVDTDRGYWSPENYAAAKREEVPRINLPKKGRLDPEEQLRQSTPAFKRGQRWRAGGEAKISWLKRTFGLKRCQYRGDRGLAVWVGGGIIACNLVQIARLLRT